MPLFISGLTLRPSGGKRKDLIFTAVFVCVFIEVLDAYILYMLLGIIHIYIYKCVCESKYNEVSLFTEATQH